MITKFNDLECQQRRIRSQLEKNILAVLDHGKYIMGPEIEILEKQLADFTGVKNAISCASGTDALLLSLMAQGIGPGDIVFTSPFTFIATAEVIQLLGAVPVFVDIDPTTFNIDPGKLLKAISAITTGESSGHPLPQGLSKNCKPKAVIAVDLFGLPADYMAINRIAQDHNLFVIEDAAQSFGAEYQGKKACSLANVGCTSFFPAKPLGCYGDGGMCFTNDDEMAAVIESIRVHGKGTDKYDNIRIGINGRLDTIQAAVLLAKMSIFAEDIELRQQVARRYQKLFSGIDSLTIPQEPADCKSVWAQFSILARDTEQRDHIQKELNKMDIPTAIYYPKPLHQQKAFAHLGYQKGSFPASEDAAGRILSLPMHPYLEASQQELITESISLAI
ncbi:DegT/DnrJ/EryC1/StrS family aminotransferase [Desulfopila sp. IMCC35006]|uniref:DegT/DnrJ/EryC1/StrS family aminotransferase n=1 Tax=Desulfopila sp. IMCC35006 TaxID=2569542 RepID=UPI0010AD9D98|nr:DegT/DnrJ/EryC1/StrS family aminotransferase [Desulfopila sp. IMCC35006]TKB23970.1 DegT/DnrJ/EryC1/StrS family aminotransferase [Desulfopila sp. IMCC35006]